ncbi:MAG TPA: hypothetical protein VFQ53_40710 [Kofleriaceae bacterium]|nr:hypothetical protein [Kofleriaceae bacterium]
MLLGGCGDNKTVETPGVDAPDTGDEVKLTDPEGGNIIFEFIYLDTDLQMAFGLPAGVTTINRVMAYFMNHQTPETSVLPQPLVCNNLEATKGWPLFVGSPHEDLDVGTLTITGTNSAGAPVSLDIAKQPAGTDAIGRPHDLYYQAINPPAEDFVGFDRSYTVSFGGSADIPATTFQDIILMSAAFTVTNPGLEDNGPLVAGTDFPVSWTPGDTTTLPPGDEVLGVVWLVDATGKPTHMCPTSHQAGTFTIPGSSITEFRSIATARGVTPDKMILLRNAIVHHPVRLPNGDPNNKRRVDMLSVNCWAQLMDVTAAALR